MVCHAERKLEGIYEMVDHDILTILTAIKWSLLCIPITWFGRYPESQNTEGMVINFFSNYHV